MLLRTSYKFIWGLDRRHRFRLSQQRRHHHHQHQHHDDDRHHCQRNGIVLAFIQMVCHFQFHFGLNIFQHHTNTNTNTNKYKIQNTFWCQFNENDSCWVVRHLCPVMVLSKQAFSIQPYLHNNIILMFILICECVIFTYLTIHTKIS